eukprot:3634142-Rhodomonas_salina.1
MSGTEGGYRATSLRLSTLDPRPEAQDPSLQILNPRPHNLAPRPQGLGPDAVCWGRRSAFSGVGQRRHSRRPQRLSTAFQRLQVHPAGLG